MAWIFVVALVPAGCGSPPDAGPKVCAPGERTRGDGTCQPAGLPPDMPCPPGELPLDGGACQKAGVPECAVGFMLDGKDGCEPILPPDPCPPGQLAVPGDTSCHEVAPCGSSTWGNIPVEANTQFVDEAYAGGNSDGTQAHPWTTIQQGINAASKGAIVAVAAGSYPEDLLILSRPVRLWGRCPSMVEVTGAGVELGAIRVLHTTASGAEIHGVAVTGARVGIVVRDVDSVALEQVWVHDTGDWGLDVEAPKAATSVVLKGSLLEQNREEGVHITASEATIEASVVRATLPDAQGNFGRGISIEDSTVTKARANATVRACLVEKNQGLGVVVLGSDATIEATVVRSNLPDGHGSFGDGIDILNDVDTTERANVTVRACLVEKNRHLGVGVGGSDATIEATVIRSTLLDPQEQIGAGIGIQDDPSTKARANVTMSGCLIEQNQEAGVFVAGSDATMETTVVRSTLANAQGKHGIGISIEDHPDTKERANVTVRACLVEDNKGPGVSVFGSDATIEASVVHSTLAGGPGTRGSGILIGNQATSRANATVRDCLVENNEGLGVGVMGSDVKIETSVVRSTLPSADGELGDGIFILDDPDTKAHAEVIITACLVEQSHGLGVGVLYSDATIEDTTVRDTAAQSDDTYGDGIFVGQGVVEIRNAEVTRNARAGVSNFGGQVVITGGVFTCNAFDLDGESDPDSPFSFDGSTGWQCSAQRPAACTALSYCRVESSSLTAPPPPPPADPLQL